MASKLWKRISALGLGAALSLGIGIGAGSGVALAADGEDELKAVTGVTSGLDAGAIDSTQKGLLEIRLTRKNPNDDPANPTVPNGSTANYTVKVSKVNGVATVGGDYAKLAKMTVAQARAKGLTSVGSSLTNSQGVVQFADLELGMYLVESTPPTSPVADYLKFYPSLVTLPYGDATSGSPQWSYGLGLVPKPVAKVAPAPNPPSNNNNDNSYVEVKPNPDPTKTTPTPKTTPKISRLDTPEPTITPGKPELPPLPKGVDPRLVTDPYDIPGWIYDPEKNQYLPNPDDPRVAGVNEKIRWGLLPPGAAGIPGILASTGVQVGGAVALSGGLIILGLFLMRRRGRDSAK